MNPPNATDDSAKITCVIERNTVLLRAGKNLVDCLHVFLVGRRKNHDVFYDTTCVWDVIEHVKDSSAKVVTDVSDAHGESDVLESSKRCRENRRRAGLDDSS